MFHGGTDTALETRYQSVRTRVADAARRAGRRPDDVLIVAVTKYAEPDQIRRLIELGHVDFGENRVQALLQRAPMIEEFLRRQRVLPHARVAHLSGAGLLGPGAAEPHVRWHMIGHLQRNKARKCVEFCRLIHSVDSLRLAEELQAIGQKRDKPIEVLIEVNCSGEASKSGCPMPAAAHLVAQLDTMVFVRPRGLMTMGPLIADPAESRRAARDTFARCRELFEDVRRTGAGEGRFNLLSMGMSGDFEDAIEFGSNLVRVGTAVFGEPRHPIEDTPEDD
jgi:pyridoxal phosphate enzyme (YggS family)